MIAGRSLLNDCRQVTPCMKIRFALFPETLRYLDVLAFNSTVLHRPVKTWATIPAMTAGRSSLRNTLHENRIRFVYKKTDTDV